MNDNQKTAVIEAINHCQTGTTGLSTPMAPMARRACTSLHISMPEMRFRQSGMSVSRDSIEIAEGASVLTMLHALAHAATPSIYPAHGAEFCANMLAAAAACAPAQAEQLRAEFDSRGVHYTGLHRRRAVIKAVIQRATDGTRVVEAIFADPTERAVGVFAYDRTMREVRVGDDCYPLDRLRYLAKIS